MNENRIALTVRNLKIKDRTVFDLNILTLKTFVDIVNEIILIYFIQKCYCHLSSSKAISIEI